VAAFDEEVATFAAELAKRPPSALTLTKGLLYELADLPMAGPSESAGKANS
jgi:enoyl-CoA hydratase/carnithine racemase